LEEKDEQIEALKQQVEMFESQEAELQARVTDLKEENESLEKQVKKWISKFDQEIEKNSSKFAALNHQIKQLQEEKFQLELQTKLDTSL
jgi:predicted RNase H-like nuclease (RuvC/YqgF family)